MTKYRVTRHDPQTIECRVFEDGKFPCQLPHIPVHSPSGFNCGYAGDGPLDLAIALLAHHLQEDFSCVSAGFMVNSKEHKSKAIQKHVQFCRDIVEHLILDDGESYTLTSEQIGHWLLEGLL